MAATSDKSWQRPRTTTLVPLLLTDSTCQLHQCVIHNYTSPLCSPDERIAVAREMFPRSPSTATWKSGTACQKACIIPATGLPWTLPHDNPTRQHALWHA